MTDVSISAARNTTASQEPLECRLCGGKTEVRFSLRVLQKYSVRYFHCLSCGSLQTETPYWLEEAYGSNLSSLDTGAASRNWKAATAVWLAARLLSARNILDFGGGSGLLCRLLRDHCLNCFVADRYAQPQFAQGFSTPDFAVPDMVVSFEVLEHFAHPAQEVEQILGRKAKAALVSTELYRGQSPDWWYFAPETGQHLFFYSEKAIRELAQRYHYHVLVSGGYLLFYQPDQLTRFRTFLLKTLLRAKPQRLLQAGLALLPTPGIEEDHRRLRNSLNSASSQPTSEAP